jgi:hypothetical protein
MAKVLFIDESGDHSLTKIDHKYPVFTLCGIIMEENYHHNFAHRRIQEFKQRLFGTSDIVLHTADFTRNKAGFERMVKHSFRMEFFGELERLIAELEFKIVAAVIRKQDHLDKYGLNAIDPYLLSLSLLVERFIFECGAAGGTIIAEARDPTLNNALDLAFLNLKIQGTDYLSAAKIQKRIHNFAIRDKAENLAGLQIADVIASPIGRRAIGKTTYPAYCSLGDFFQVLKPKFRQDWKGRIEGMGLITLPK